MITEVIREVSNGHVQIDPPLSEILNRGREKNFPPDVERILDTIGDFGLPGLDADATLLVATYYYKFGAQDAAKALKIHFGEDIENTLGVSFDRRGTLQVPGMHRLVDTATENYPEELNELLRIVRDMKMPVRYALNKASVITQKVIPSNP